MEDSVKEPVKTKKDLFLSRLREKYPDNKFEDEEEIYGRVNDDYDDYDNQLSTYKDSEKKLSDLFNSDPRSASFLMGWSQGGDPVVELVKRFGSEIADAVNDPSKIDDIAKANKDYLERVAENAELEKQYEANIAQSVDDIEKLKVEQGYSDEQIDEGMQKISQIAHDAILGKFPPETLDFIFKAMFHDKDVQTAAYEGEVRGRNSKIEEKIKSRKKGDGLPAGMPGRNAPQSSLKKKDLGALERLGNGSIWD